MKRSELLFSAIQVPIDFIMLVAAAVAAFFLRDALPQIIPSIPPRLFTVSLEEYVTIVLMIVPFFILIYAVEGLYMMRVTRKPLNEVWMVARATTIGLMIIIIAVFLNREWFSSRIVILMGWVLSIIFVVSARMAIRMIQRFLVARRLIGVHRVLLIGDEHSTHAIRHYIATHPYFGYRVVGRIDTAHTKKINEIRQTKGVDEIIVCDTSLSPAVIEKMMNYCKVNNITMRLIPTRLQTALYEFASFAGEPMITFLHTPLDGWGKILKRAFDIVASSIFILLTSPLFLIIALLIKLEDPDGPIVYKNERVGNDGKKFFVYKFRYMKWKYSISKDNPRWREALAFEQKLIKERSVRNGPVYKIKNDPRKTRIGTFIEKYSLDELPQFFNVLFGSMSLVGPRPHQAREVEKYKEYHRQLLTIKPGLTGMAQVSGRSDLDFEDEYKLDVFYIEHWSLWLDIIICLKTAQVLFARRKNNS